MQNFQRTYPQVAVTHTLAKQHQTKKQDLSVLSSSCLQNELRHECVQMSIRWQRLCAFLPCALKTKGILTQGNSCQQAPKIILPSVLQWLSQHGCVCRAWVHGVPLGAGDSASIMHMRWLCFSHIVVHASHYLSGCWAHQGTRTNFRALWLSCLSASPNAIHNAKQGSSWVAKALHAQRRRHGAFRSCSYMKRRHDAADFVSFRIGVGLARRNATEHDIQVLWLKFAEKLCEPRNLLWLV